MRLRFVLAAAALLWGCGDSGGGGTSTPAGGSGGGGTVTDTGPAGGDVTPAPDAEAPRPDGLVPAPDGPPTAPPDMGLPPECTVSVNCAQGQLCLNGRCQACGDDAQCKGDARYGNRTVCVEGACVIDACPNGRFGCECKSDGTCDMGECVNATCVDCTRGQLACICTDNGSCDRGGRCEGGICVECPAGASGCPCGEGDTCSEANQTCQEGVCADRACVAGTDGCPCGPPLPGEGGGGGRGADGTCGEGLVCGGDDICRPCAADMAGCPCVDDACEVDLVCDAEDTTCREEKTCEEAECVLHQRCDEGEAGADATCLEACDDGFVWNAGVCDPAPPQGCAGPTGGDCAGRNRACVEDAGGVASCGGCLAGFIETAGVCRLPLSCLEAGCANLNRSCMDGGGVADSMCLGCIAGFAEINGVCAQPPGCEALGCADRHRECAGEPPACGDCLPGYQANGADCAPRPSCDPEAPGTIAAECARHGQRCEEQNNGAVCGACEDEAQLLNPASGDCEGTVRCGDLGCDALGRACVGEPFASCGGCVNGTRPADPDDPASACVTPLGCDEIACPENEFCLEGQDGADAECVRSLCGPGEAYREDRDLCVACNINCGEEGETGEVWPFTLAFSNDCICQTQTGYYWQQGGLVRAQPCDGDGDGWVRVSAYTAINDDENEAIRDNARCELRWIDRFVLENEYAQRMEVRSCADGWVSDPDVICATEPIALYESVRNDDADSLSNDLALDAPTYAANGFGRPLRPEELNPLTKACVSPAADFDDDQQADVQQHQAKDPPDADVLPQPLWPFLAFANFVELHRNFYEAPGDGERFGRYVIQERSRCELGFALTYAEGEGDWWKSCARNRDFSWDANVDNLAPVNFDFAQYGCDAATGSCTLPPPPTSALPRVTIPPHGLCDVPQMPQDGIWRGMNHHSQFKCVQVSTPAEMPADRRDAPQRVLGSELYNGAQNERALQFNRCRVACTADDPNCEADCPAGAARCQDSSESPGVLANPSRPVVTCEPVLQDARDTAVAARAVGFASVRYIDSPGTYARGCINEWQPVGQADLARPWKALCPGYTQNPAGVDGLGHPDDFGKLVCGCSLHYGGDDCLQGCPSFPADLNRDGVMETDVGGLMYGGPAENVGGGCVNGYCTKAATDNGGGRRRFWMCGGFTATSFEPPADFPADAEPVLSGGRFTIRGGVTHQPFSQARLCESEDCATGFTLQNNSAIDLGGEQ